MPFRYEFKLNKNKISGFEIGFSTSRKWEEALDEAKLSLPFYNSSEPFSQLGLLEMEISHYQGEVLNKTEKHEMLITSDRVSNSTRYGKYRHDINAIEYTSKLDYYIMTSLAKTRNILNKTDAPFSVIEELNFPIGDNNFRTFANVENIQVKSQYYTNQEITFEQVRKAYQATTPLLSGSSDFREADVYITTNAPLVSGTKPFNLSSGNCTWVFPKGRWYVDYQVDVLDALVGWSVTDGLHTLYRYYIEVVDEATLTMYDVINTIRNSISVFGGIESEKYFDLTRVFDIDEDVGNYLKTVQAPQMYLENATARQMLIFALSYVNSIPRLEYNGSIDVLKIEQYNLQQGVFSIKDLMDYSGSQNTNQIGTRSFSSLKQALPDDLTEANVFSPSQSGYQNVRSSVIQITADNFEIKLPKPIYMPIGLYVLVPQIKIKSMYDALPTVRTFTNVEIDLTSRWINIEEWRLKQITINFPTITQIPIWSKDLALKQNAVSNLYWQQGDTSIKLSDVYGQIFGTNLITNVVKEAVFEYFTRNMLEPIFIDSNTLVDEYEIEVTLPSSSQYLDWKFRVEYISDETLVLKHDKEDLSQINFYSEMKHNQDESIINVVRASRKIYGDLQRSGNKQFSFSKIHYDLESFYLVGQKDVNNYTITSITKEYYNDYIIATYFVTKYHNRIQQATYIDQTYRWRDNYAKSVLDRHENYTDYVVVVPPENTNVTEQFYNKIASKNITIRMMLNNILGVPITDSKVSTAIIRTDGMYEVLEEVEGWRYALSTPVSSYGIKGGLAFTFGFKGNQVAGDGVVIRDGKYYNKAERYTNTQGRFNKFGFWLLRDLQYSNLFQYPLIENEMGVVYDNGLFNTDDEYFGCGNLDSSTPNYLGDDPLVVEKDTMTNFALTYQLNVVSYIVNQYIIGLNFYTKNFLVNNPNGLEKSYLHVYTNGTKYEMFEDIQLKSNGQRIYELGGTRIVYDEDENTVRFIGDVSLTNATSWAIVNQDDELLIACNEPLNGFDLKLRHFRPNIKGIGVKEQPNIFPELNFVDNIDLETIIDEFKSTDFVINFIGQDNISVTSQIVQTKSTDFSLPFSDSIMVFSEISNYKTTDIETTLSDTILELSIINEIKSTDYQTTFNENIGLNSEAYFIITENSEITLNDSLLISSTVEETFYMPTVNSIAFNTDSISVSSVIVDSVLIPTINSTAFTDTMGITSVIVQYNYTPTINSTNFLESIFVSSVLNVLNSKEWVYTGTMGTYDDEFDYVANGSTCATQLEILTYLNTYYPPNDYAIGYRIRVFRKNEDLVLCRPMNYYFEVV